MKVDEIIIPGLGLHLITTTEDPFLEETNIGWQVSANDIANLLEEVMGIVPLESFPIRFNLSVALIKVTSLEVIKYEPLEVIVDGNWKFVYTGEVMIMGGLDGA